jgi:Bacterial PH domain
MTRDARPYHEHEFEPQHGLPERLPADERLLWQGTPRWDVLARRVFHVHLVALYFLVLAVWRIGSVIADGGTAAEALRVAAWLLPVMALGLGLLVLLAVLSARTTVYTLTDRRIVMRIGIVLTVAYNLPLRRIEGADLRPCAPGVADIALTLEPQTRIAWLHLWPHVRPWRVARPQPTLRALPDADRVATLLHEAWAAAVPAGGATGAGAAPSVRLDRPAMAGR